MNAPDPDTLRTRPLHLLVRDWPELLAVLREQGVDVAREGSRSLEELGRAADEELLAAMTAAASWRGSGRTGG